MINIPPVRVDTSSRPGLAPEVFPAWKVGQVLSAVATKNANANDLVLIRMGRTVLEAKTPVALNAGDRLGLAVKSLGSTPVLSILTSMPAHWIAAKNLKSFIANHQDLTALLAVGKGVISNPYLPGLIRQQLRLLAQQIPDVAQVAQVSMLKKLFQNSGIFLESKLKGRQIDSLEGDIKAHLLRVSALLQEAAPGLMTSPSKAAMERLGVAVSLLLGGKISVLQFSVLLSNTASDEELRRLPQTLHNADNRALTPGLSEALGPLLKHIELQPDAGKMRQELCDLLETMAVLRQLKCCTEGALSQLTSQQLVPLTREDGEFVLFDLYLKDQLEYRKLNIRLECEQSGGLQATPSWRITLSIDLQELGPVQVHLHLAENSISAQFRVEYAGTAERISRHAGLLEAAFNKLGLMTASVGVTHGPISFRSDLAEDVRLVDERA